MTITTIGIDLAKNVILYLHTAWPVNIFIPPDRFCPGNRFHPEFIPQPALSETFIPGQRRCATGVQVIITHGRAFF
ncbi:TPA: hypothetical protein G8V93_004769 [Salmonella enterica]|uniref:Uncharacterized protein n=1 Tax=Salmonella enterica TaxID=28901 RepID=A0A759H4H3_SALER|nr:hypothetical protein [Salmonella enterica]